MTAADDRVGAHLDRFNEAVRSGDWGPYLAGLSDSVRMEFVGVPVGPFDGKSAVAEAYRANPPDDTLTVVGRNSEGAADVVRFAWDRGGQGILRITWTPDDRVDRQVIEFT